MSDHYYDPDWQNTPYPDRDHNTEQDNIMSVETNPFLPTIKFSAQADGDTLMSLLVNWTVEITWKDGSTWEGWVKSTASSSWAFNMFDPVLGEELIGVIDLDNIDDIAKVVVL